MGWTAAHVTKALKEGKDKEDKDICSPMPKFMTLADQDLTDIVNYVLALPPIDNTVAGPASCPAP